MEGVERRAQNIEHFKRDISLQFGQRHCVAEPRAFKSLATKRVTARPCKGMPVGNGEAQVIFHPFAKQHFVGVVVTKGKFVCAGLAFILDGGDAFEKVGHCRVP